MNQEDNPSTSNSLSTTEKSGPQVGEGGAVLPPKYHKALKNTWSFWWLKWEEDVSWQDMQNQLANIQTIDEFWCLLRKIKEPCYLQIGTDYSIFRKGIRPLWEDPANKDGGRWVITINKDANTYLNYTWKKVMLALISEAFENPAEICGAVLNIRSKNNKISVWTAHARDDLAAYKVGNFLKEIMSAGRQNLKYQVHADVKANKDSHVKPLYVL